ncbi:hypothetical protein J6590_078367 [Homalodisca vitripennis]|nr:hypothetical protein J6590_078365 [Homalodisca vitripennis]KAG8280586.1 hypothetical protein J6590_078367 [Homalodisca vitripennis]
MKLITDTELFADSTIDIEGRLVGKRVVSQRSGSECLHNFPCLFLHQIQNPARPRSDPIPIPTTLRIITTRSTCVIEDVCSFAPRRHRPVRRVEDYMEFYDEDLGEMFAESYLVEALDRAEGQEHDREISELLDRLNEPQEVWDETSLDRRRPQLPFGVGHCLRTVPSTPSTPELPQIRPSARVRDWYSRECIAAPDGLCNQMRELHLTAYHFLLDAHCEWKVRFAPQVWRTVREDLEEFLRSFGDRMEDARRNNTTPPPPDAETED